MLVVAAWAGAYARPEMPQDGGVEAPQRTVQRTDDGITVAYTFTGNGPSACNARDGGCVWRIEGFGLRDASGGYATPFRVDAFAVPEGCTAVVETVDSAFVDYVRRSLTMIAASLRRGVFLKKALRQRVW